MPILPSHFFVSSTDGALHDTREPDWTSKPLRANYSGGYGDNSTLAGIKARLRNGRYAWPGGYPLFFITSDGGALSFQTVLNEWRQVVAAHLSGLNDGWRVVACAVNWEQTDLYCDHTGEQIESAYGDDDDDDDS